MAFRQSPPRLLMHEKGVLCETCAPSPPSRFQKVTFHGVHGGCNPESISALGPGCATLELSSEQLRVSGSPFNGLSFEDHPPVRPAVVLTERFQPRSRLCGGSIGTMVRKRQMSLHPHCSELSGAPPPLPQRYVHILSQNL